MNVSPTGYAALNAVLDRARRSAGPATPVTDDQLRALQARWVARLTARLDQAVERYGPALRAAGTAEVWHRLAADEPVLRAVLDEGLPRLTDPRVADPRVAEYRVADPRLTGSRVADPRVAEYRALALAAGLVGVEDPVPAAAEVGRRLLDARAVPLRVA